MTSLKFRLAPTLSRLDPNIISKVEWILLGTTLNIKEMKKLASESGLEVENISYCERMTVNKKENVEAKRLFLQARFLDLNFSPSL